MAEFFFIVSCEHASRHIPHACRRWIPPQVTASHRAYDLGALAYARELAGALQAHLFTATVSRLLVDTNRSLHHPRLHSLYLRDAPAELKQRLVQTYYLPYRQQIELAIASALSRKQNVIHLAAHSFTPELDGITRNAELGLLYDPRRRREKNLALAWQSALHASKPEFRIRRNYPYRGRADGFPSALRRRNCEKDYLGLEIEINQAMLCQQGRAAAGLRAWFVRETAEFFKGLGAG